MPAVDQVRVVATGAVSSSGLTPPTAAAPVSLPVLTALALPSGTVGTIDVTVTGLLGGTPVGHGSAQATLAADERRTIDVALVTGTSPGDGGVDLGVGDLGGDLSVPQDLPPPPDLSASDLILSPRHVFLLSARAGALGSLDDLDTACSAEAHGAALSLAPYRAVVAYQTVDPVDHIKLFKIAKPVVTPSGTLVSTDESFFQFGGHVAGIDELSDRSAPTVQCAWSNFGPTGIRIESAGDCNDWQSVDGGFGNFGSLTDPNEWNYAGNTTCGQSCHVFCIEQ